MAFILHIKKEKRIGVFDGTRKLKSFSISKFRSAGSYKRATEKAIKAAIKWLAEHPESSEPKLIPKKPPPSYLERQKGGKGRGAGIQVRVRKINYRKTFYGPLARAKAERVAETIKAHLHLQAQ